MYNPKDDSLLHGSSFLDQSLISKCLNSTIKNKRKSYLNNVSNSKSKLAKQNNITTSLGDINEDEINQLLISEISLLPNQDVNDVTLSLN